MHLYVKILVYYSCSHIISLRHSVHKKARKISKLVQWLVFLKFNVCFSIIYLVRIFLIACHFKNELQFPFLYYSELIIKHAIISLFATMLCILKMLMKQKLLQVEVAEQVCKELFLSFMGFCLRSYKKKLDSLGREERQTISHHVSLFGGST